MDPQSRSFAALILVLLILGLGFANLYDKSFWASHMESRRTLVARNMVETGDWLIPRVNGKVILTKPPLYFWTVAATFKLTGRYDEGTARLPSVLFGLGLLWLTFIIGRRMFDPLTGAFAASGLATTQLFSQYMRMAEMDMMFAFFIALAFYFMLRFMEEGEDGEHPQYGSWPLWFWAALAAAFMVKGPFAPMFTLASFFALLPLREKGRRMDAVNGILCKKGFLLFAIIVAPWFLYAFIAADAASVFGTETLNRLVSDKGKPHIPFFYIVSLLNYAPWVILLPFALYWSIKREFRAGAFAVSWFIVGMLVASIIKTKSIHYILPLYPAAAIIVGRFVAAHSAGEMEEYKGLDKTACHIGLALAFLPLVAFIALPFAPLFTDEVPLFPPLMLLLFIAVTAVLAIRALGDFRGGRREYLWIKVFTSLFLTFIFIHAVAEPRLNTRNSRKDFFVELKTAIPPRAKVRMYRLDNFQAPFYMERVVPDMKGGDQLRKFADEMDSMGENYFIITQLRYVPDVIRETGGAVKREDNHFVPPRKSMEERRLALIEITNRKRKENKK